MEASQRLEAIEAIKRVKARYFRGVDTSTPDLVRSLLAADCVLDYRGCCTDPTTGRDFFPEMNIVVRGREAWSSQGLKAMGIVSVHQGHHCEVTLETDASASSIWSMTDRLFMPVEAAFAELTGYGHYHETYEKDSGTWMLKTLRIERIRVEAKAWS
jgi:hypothetical protein